MWLPVVLIQFVLIDHGRWYFRLLRTKLPEFGIVIKRLFIFQIQILAKQILPYYLTSIFQVLLQRVKFETGASFGIYLDYDPENIEIDDLIAIGLDNGEILILNNENIVSKDCLS